MAMFASVDDLADRLQTDFDTEDRVRAHRLIEHATGMVQHAARQRFELVTDDEIGLMPTGTRLLLLPELPVVDITSVNAVGSLDEESYTFTRSGLLYHNTGRWNTVTTVVYTHGYDPIPDDVAAMVVDIAARAWQNPRSVLSEQIGTYSARYPNNRTGLSLLEDELNLLHQYRPAPG